ncbi:MAG: hypothetical protein KF724_01655 [Phycisphaeraceae bacterium]|nr:hypothetical protein [Phycisphaeraceae bacterium]
MSTLLCSTRAAAAPRRFLAASLASMLCLAAAAPLFAQQQDVPRAQDRRGQGGGFGGMRGGGMMGGPGGGFMRRAMDGFRPEFMRRDLPLIREQLALDDTQRMVVEQLLLDYDEAFNPASQEAQEKIRNSMQEIAAGFFNPAMRERMESAMQGLRADIEQIAAESGGEIDPEVRAALIRERMGKFQDEMIREREQSGAQAQTRETIGRMIDTMEDWHNQRRKMRDDLLAGIRAILSEQQAEKWESFDRFMRRERTIPLGSLSGEQVDLFAILDEANLSEEVMATLVPTLDRYEMELDQALRARNTFLEQSEIRFLRAAQSGNSREVEDTARRSADLHRAVRDINDRYRVEVVALLPEELRSQVQRAALVAGYDRVYRPTQAERAFEAALEWDDITPEVRTAIANLSTQFGVDVASLNERMMTHLRRQEPLDIVEQSGAIISMVNGLPPMGMGMGRRFGVGGDTPDPMQDMLSKRGDLNDAYMRRLRDLLSPEQQEKLPQRGRGGRWGDFPGGGQGGGMLGTGRIADMPEGIREQARRFDTNNDGVLDETERAAAIEEMRRQFGGGRGRGDGEGGGRRGAPVN